MDYDLFLDVDGRFSLVGSDIYLLALASYHWERESSVP